MESFWNLLFTQQQQQAPEAAQPAPPAKKPRTDEIQQPQQESLRAFMPILMVSNPTGNQTVHESLQPVQPIFSVGNAITQPASSWTVPVAVPNPHSAATAPKPPPVQQTPIMAAAVPASALPSFPSTVMEPIRSVSVTTSAAEVLERKRKRNVETARRARLRKKNQEAHLKLELLALQRENERLRAIVKNELPEDSAQQVIGECCYNKPCGSSWHSVGEEYKKLGRSDFEMIESLTKSHKSFCLTDPRLPDNPIVYASSAFIELTGYPREQVVGRNCRFLQGPETDPEAVKEIRDAVANGKDGAACLLNYKADGAPFWNEFFVAPLRDRENRIVNFVSSNTRMHTTSEFAKTVSSFQMIHTIYSVTAFLLHYFRLEFKPKSAKKTRAHPLYQSPMPAWCLEQRREKRISPRNSPECVENANCTAKKLILWTGPNSQKCSKLTMSIRWALAL